MDFGKFSVAVLSWIFPWRGLWFNSGKARFVKNDCNNKREIRSWFKGISLEMERRGHTWKTLRQGN